MEGGLGKSKEQDNCNQSEIPYDTNNYSLSSYGDAKQCMPLGRPDDEDIACLRENNKENPSKRKRDSDNLEEDTQVFKKSKQTSDETPEDENLSDAREDELGQNFQDDNWEKESKSWTQNVDTILSEIPPENKKAEDLGKEDIQVDENCLTVPKYQEGNSRDDETSHLVPGAEIIYKRQEELDETNTGDHEQVSQAEDNSLSTKNDERSSSSEDDEPQTAPEIIYKRPEAERFPKLYRLLRDDENFHHGLKAKNPRSNLRVAEHVAEGSSSRSGSKYISTCSNISSAEKWRSLKSSSRCYRNGTMQIVEIDVNELPLSVGIIDLTTKELREKYELPGYYRINRLLHTHAERFTEVLLKGTVPASCVKEYSNVI